MNHSDAILLPELDLYKTYLRDEARRSPYTVRGYTGEVRLALRWIEVQLKRPLRLADLTLDQLRAYQRSCKRVAPTTMGRKISALCSFCKYLRREQRLSTNIALELERPSVPKRIPCVPTLADVRRLIDLPRTMPQLHGRPANDVIRVRDAAILEAFAAVGPRSAEMRELPTERVRFEQDTTDGKDQVLLHLRGKGARDRIVPGRGEILGALQAYLARRHELNPKSDALFVSAKTGRALSPFGMYLVVYRWGRRAGLKMHPHLLRHWMATHLSDRGVLLVHIQQMLGHAKLSTTAMYVHPVGRQLGARCAARHPHAVSTENLPTTLDPEMRARLARMPLAELAQVMQLAAALLGQVLPAS